MSIGFLTPDDAPVIWRGPMLHGAVTQFFRDVRWTDVDYMIVDMPPGTGDVALSLSQSVPVAGAVVVTTPQAVALADTRRAVQMYRKLNIPVIGLIENMSHFVCPQCSHESDIFGKGGGEAMAAELTVPFLGRVPPYANPCEGRRFRCADCRRRNRSRPRRAPDGGRRPRGAAVSIASFSRGVIPLTPIVDESFIRQGTLANGCRSSSTRIITRRSSRSASGITSVRKTSGPAEPVRAPLRAPDVRRVGPASRTGLSPCSRPARGEWIDERRSHELLGSRAEGRGAARVVDGGRPDGLAVAGRDGSAVRHPARVVLTRRRRTTRTAHADSPISRSLKRSIRRRTRIAGRPSATRPTFAPRVCGTCTSSSADHHPSNASLAIAGDISTAEAFRLAREYFDDISAGPPVDPVVPPDIPAGDARVVLEDRVELPRLYLGWRTPALFAAGDATMDLVGDLLANGRTSRLYKRLIHDQRIATDVAASQGSRELGSVFQVVATAAPGQSLDDIDAIVRDEIARLAVEGPSDDEIARGRQQAEASFVYRLQTLGGFGGRADQLNALRVYGHARLFRRGPSAVSRRHQGRHDGGGARSSAHLGRGGVVPPVRPARRPRIPTFGCA